jgi:hypothetical protein
LPHFPIPEKLSYVSFSPRSTAGFRRLSRKAVILTVACWVGVTAVVLSLPDATATSVTSRFSPNADAFVSRMSPDTNFGRLPTLKTSALPNLERSYVRFDMGQLPGTVVKATLRLYGRPGVRLGSTIWSTPDRNWDEDRITSANAPTLGQVVTRADQAAKEGWTSVDVTTAVRGGGVVTFALSAGGASAAVFASRERGVTGPQLVVDTRTTGAVAAAPTPSSTTVRPTTTGRTAGTTVRSTTTATSATSTPSSSAGPGLSDGDDFTGKDRFGLAAGCCIQYRSAAGLARELDDYKAMGVRWLRFDMAWSGVQADGRDSYDWGPYDRLVRAARDRDIKLLGMIGYTPAWARPADCRGDDKCAPANVQDFAFFAGQAARRYGSLGLHAWEIWNEQNGDIFWKPGPNPTVYASMLKASYKAIKQNDGDAWVVTGGLMPAETGGGFVAPTDFLTAMYRSGAKGSFDAVGAHPYCWAGSFDCPNRYASWSAWSQMSGTRSNLRSVMAANGDQDKLIWATEYGAPSAGGAQAVGEVRQAKQVVDGFRLFSSYRWTGPLFWYSYRDACTDPGDTECHFGLVRHDGSRKPALAAYRRSSTGAS